MSWSTPLGDDLDSAWQRLLARRDGFAAVESALPLRNDLVAAIPSVPMDMAHGDRMHTLTTGRLRAACADAGLDPGHEDVALVLGTSYGEHLDAEVPSLYGWAQQAAEATGFTNEPVCVSTACSAASDAVLVGAELVRSGACRAAVCGGADILTPAKRLGHSKLGTMSPARLRAFDADHLGMLLGEGAGFLVIEPDAGRAGRSHAVLRGVGSSNDAVGTTAPDADGGTVRLAIEHALRAAGLDADDIAVVSAHGTGTVLSDEAEARGITRAFAGCAELPVVFGTKGALGHSLGACGAIEAITLILSLRDQVAPPILGLHRPIPEADSLVRPGSREVRGTAGISLTLGFGGFNTAIAFSVEREEA